MMKKISRGGENKIILIGYRGTGKTSIGKRLAERLHLSFVDTDRLVEEAAGKTIREIIGEGGWVSFRKKEREAIKALTSLPKSVIATGGGAVMDEENAALLKKEGVLIWLTAGVEIILQRLDADAATTDQRPPLSHDDLRKEVADTLAVRTPVYRRLADFSIDTGASGIDASVERIVGWLLEPEDG